ncbi:tryptophan-rich sensory protein [Aquimarina sp. ERC-38]|uniref:tryptophan-rich sensory protein n=1 Tax=Aquimarina sp. ERC-38 TaxID=2949996 RepID=UPI0022454E62|nr:tryptophan-rich sensory protein [Aquimarina sp. ERC-38]UZO81946.1 tryptophan-rich sensory protein [Aquimarina sp. ERC-38]
MDTKKKSLVILNALSVLLVLAINYASQVFKFNDATIADISDKYDNLFTPAGYAFSIWGLIFLNLIIYSSYQIKRTFFSTKESDFVLQTGSWFFLANLLNAAWVIAFTYDFIGLSVFFMFGILFSLVQIMIRTNMERWDAPIGIIACVWWPICLYTGWISVATVANVATYLVKINWSGWGISPEWWTLLMIIVVVLLNLYLLVSRNLREFLLVTIWALVAIYVRHKTTFDNIAWTAMVAAVLLFISVGIHGFKNRETNPFKKFLEWKKG